MGRYVSGSNDISVGGFANGVPTIFRTSKSGVEIPEWARGGWMEIWGCGAGGGQSLGSGGHGAVATGLRMVVPVAGTSMSISIGAAGANGVSGSSSGTTGGATTLSIDGVEFIRLNGGYGGASSSTAGGRGGDPYIFGESIEPSSGSGGQPNYATVLASVIAASASAPVVTRVAPGPAGYTYTGNEYKSSAALFGAGTTGYGSGAPIGGTARPGLLSVQFLANGG